MNNRRYLALLTALALGACASPGRVSAVDPVPEINNDGGVALKGFDPVAYFADHHPVPGNPAITARWHGAVWQFASDDHRREFLADPTHYAPQYGGFCAFAISRGQIADIDPDLYAVEDNKLYLNNNSVVHRIWNLDRPGNIVAGNQNWPLVPKVPVH